MTTPPPTGGGVVMDDPRTGAVRSLARLRERAQRERTGLFLAEGPPSVSEALADALAPAGGSGSTSGPTPRRRTVREVVITPDAARRHADLVAAAAAAGVRVRLASERVLAAVCDTTTPQGVVAVCAARDVPLARALRPAEQGGPALVAVLVGASDPGNAGTVVRSADAAGAGAVVLTSGSVDAHGPRCVRAAAGSTFHLDVVQGPPLEAVVQRARACGLAVLAADGGSGVDALDLDDLLDAAQGGQGGPPALLAGPVAWLFGHEARGLEPAQRALADAVVRVPLHGRAESLNLAAAATVCLYASARSRRRR